MNFIFGRGLRFIFVFSLAFLFLCMANLYAQKVPINFNDYHGYNGAVDYIQKVAKAYPNITELLEIGKSTMGRPIYVLVISNKKTGTTIDAHVKLQNTRKEGVKNVIPMKPYLGKPGFWIDGALHGNEYTGSEVSLYIIDKLLTGYGSNMEITQLIDKNTFYINPVSNPDGVYRSVEEGVPQRQNSMNKDDDGDGKINEDGPDDLNGDGYITQFRYKDEKGRYVIDNEDPRLMVRLGRNETTTKQRYSVIREDKDNDGDGKRGEDSVRGIDLNRNFPEKWFKNNETPGGSGDYHTSSPEARAIAEFFVNHRNIFMVQNYHTSGGFTYRPASSSTEAAMHQKDVAIYDMIMGKKYLELIGDELPEAWLKPDSLAKIKAKLKNTSKDKFAIARGYEMPRGWVYNRDGVLSFGVICDWMHLQQGVYAITTELWNSSKDIPGSPEFTGPDARLKQSRFYLKYQDENYDGKYFISWKKYKHPELGDGEIGGWIPKYSGINNAFPGEPLLNVCETHWQFELFRAGLLPEVTITDAKTKILYTTNNASQAKVNQRGNQVTIKKSGSKGKYKIVEVNAIIENKGKLATHTARGANLAGNREDVVWLLGDRNKISYIQGSAFQKLGVLEGQMKIPGYKEKSNSTTSLRQQNQQRQRGQADSNQNPQQKGSKREIKWLIAVEGDTQLKVVVSSQKGGTKVKNLTIR